MLALFNTQPSKLVANEEWQDSFIRSFKSYQRVRQSMNHMLTVIAVTQPRTTTTIVYATEQKAKQEEIATIRRSRESQDEKRMEYFLQRERSKRRRQLYTTHDPHAAAVSH